MADYYSQTVIQQTIPETDMTTLERLILSHIFTVEREDGRWYFYAEENPPDLVALDRDKLVEALGSARAIADETALVACVANSLSQARRDAVEIELDLSGGVSWELIFQGIVRRSSTLRYITATAAFTCTRMRADGFGGMAVLITADRVFSKSTNDLIDEFAAEAGLSD